MGKSTAEITTQTLVSATLALQTLTMVEDKYIGLGLAVGGTVCIGWVVVWHKHIDRMETDCLGRKPPSRSSFIITKKGLNDAANNRHTYSSAATGGTSTRNASEDLAYLRNPIWWTGMVTMVVGEVANFAAYTFAPAILVTPLGALSVIIGAILASFLLDEKLGRLGILGCASCLIGSVIIILHAPADPDVNSVDEILNYATQPGE